LFPLFVTSAIDTGGKYYWCRWCRWQFPTGGNLQPVSLTLAAIVVAAGGKFATGINNTMGTGWENLPLVSLIPVANLDL
jgi:hypothetical protein